MYDTGVVKVFRPCVGRVDTNNSGLDKHPREGRAMAGDLEVAVLTATFDARPDDEDPLAAALARYVVLTRNVPACRNVDLVMSATQRGRFLVVEKWDSADDVQRHLNSDLMTGMAREVLPLLAAKPAIDLYDTISAHDLA
jgi:quinol monooxygenase YgiN